MMDQAKGYIKAHYGSAELSAKQVADHVGLTPNYFSNVFKQYVGVSFVKYLTGYRMDKAKELLRTTDKTVVEIAEEVGYHNPNYFSAVFHRATGVPPLRFRKADEEIFRPRVEN